MEPGKANAVEALERLIESGRYPQQGRLPPERVLADRLGITRTALRKALSVLEAQNRIWRHVGRGTFVGPRAESLATDALAGLTNTTHPAEIMETRLVLEPKIAAIAALRATKNDLDRLIHCLGRGESAADFATFEHWDEALHLAVSESTQNLLLVSMFKALNNLRQQQIWGRLKEAAMNSGRQKAYVLQHREIVEAIEHRNPGLAEKRMRHHLETVQKNLLGHI